MSQSVICSMPLDRASELLQLHVETQTGDHVSSLLGEGKPHGTLRPSETVANAAPGLSLSHPAPEVLLVLQDTMVFRDHSQVSPWTKDPEDRELPPNFL